MSIPDDLICTKEAAALAGVTDSYINMLARQKRIPYYQTGLSSRRMYSRQEVHNLFFGVRRVEPENGRTNLTAGEHDQ